MTKPFPLVPRNIWKHARLTGSQPGDDHEREASRVELELPRQSNRRLRRGRYERFGLREAASGRESEEPVHGDGEQASWQHGQRDNRKSQVSSRALSLVPAASSIALLNPARSASPPRTAALR